MQTAGNAGGKAPDAMMCAAERVISRVSKYLSSLVLTLTAPTVSRVRRPLR